NFPVWSTDGTRVIYWDAERGGGIYAKLVSGLGGSELLEEVAYVGTGNPGAAPNSISPDGKLLAYMGFGAHRTPRLWIHQLASEKPDAKDYPLLGTTFPEAHAQFSPDGHWLAFGSGGAGRGEGYVGLF